MIAVTAITVTWKEKRGEGKIGGRDKERGRMRKRERENKREEGRV
jgi:hypothetical protein